MRADLLCQWINYYLEVSKLLLMDWPVFSEGRLFMITAILEDILGAVKLFYQEKPSHIVGEGHGR